MRRSARKEWQIRTCIELWIGSKAEHGRYKMIALPLDIPRSVRFVEMY